MSPFPRALSPPRAAATPGAGSVQLPTSAPAPESDFLAKVELLLRMGGGLGAGGDLSSAPGPLQLLCNLSEHQLLRL